MKPGQVRVWLDQGPAVLMARCKIEGEAIAPEDAGTTTPTTESGWVVHLLMTGEILTVHEDTLT
jgi:hypothetical protein